MIIPAKGRILIKKLEREEVKSDGGIFLPGQALMEENLLYGEVVGLAKQPSDEFGDFPYTIGDKIFYSRYSATKVADEKGNIFYVLSDLDVMAHDDIATTK